MERHSRAREGRWTSSRPGSVAVRSAERRGRLHNPRPCLGILAAAILLAATTGCGGDGGGGSDGREVAGSPTPSPREAEPTQAGQETPTPPRPSPSPSRPSEPNPTSTPTVPPTATATPTPTAQRSPAPEACDVTDPCPAGQFCELPAGVCASELGDGTCADLPFVCFEQIEPVCGCDGLTYGSDCLRRGAEVQKADDGVCPAQECGDDCDCYATRTFATSCPLDCANCDSYWTCEENRCLEHCGPFPPDRCESLCFDNESCGPEAFCRKPVGRCDGLGACHPRPVPCPNVVDPVCGCDGQTYANECVAGNAGVALAHRGPCEEEPTPTPSPTPETSPSPEACDITDPCPQAEFCELPAGACASEPRSGTCVAVSGACLDLEEPVCGCDGLTYGSDCLRRAARVQKAANGACPTTECSGVCDCYATRAFATDCPLACANCGSFWTCNDGHCIEHCGMIPGDGCPLLCFANRECPPEAFCQKPIAQCDGSGACRQRPPRPNPCPDVVDPVCGCNGQTYSNECEAFRVGVSIAHRGACRPRCGTIAGIPCPQGQFCEYPPASCQIADLEGECFDLPETCLLVVAPVCGCDGVTYDNDCERQRARVQLDRPGACEEPGGR
jgi:Kazal-type serine protease inhibitor domain